MTPLFSIITIAYNEEHGIERTLKSVACQTFTDFEYIIVDGASTDRTVSVAQKYCPPITKIVSEKDTGIANAMNKGISLSSGEIIVHLNAGDEFTDADVLKRTAQSYRSAKWKWAVGSANIIDPMTGNICCIFKVMDFDYQVLKWMDTLPHQSTFVKRDIFNDYGLFDETFKLAMDYEFWMRIGQYLKPHILPFVVSNRWAGGISSNFRLSYIESCRARKKNNPSKRCQKLLDMEQLVYCYTARLAQRYLPERTYKLLLRQKYRLFPENQHQIDMKNRVVVIENVEQQKRKRRS